MHVIQKDEESNPCSEILNVKLNFCFCFSSYFMYYELKHKTVIRERLRVINVHDSPKSTKHHFL